MSEATGVMDNRANLGSEATEFRREIGLFGGVSILGGIMIGGGIFYLGSYVLMLTDFNLGLALFCWVLGGLVSLLGGLCYAELGTMIPKAGGVLVYLNEAYHPVVGFMSGFKGNLLVGPASIAAGILAMSNMFGLTGVTGQIFATVILVVLTVYNCYGIKQGAILQNVTMVAKLVPIFIIMGAAFLLGNVNPDLSGLSSVFTVTGAPEKSQILSMIGMAVLATLWAYTGWTNLNYVAEEIKNPKRNLPLALILSITGITILYTAFNYAIYRVIPLGEIKELIGNDQLYLGTETAIKLLGKNGGLLVTIGMTISMLGSNNGMIMAFPRATYAMSREGHFFNIFGRLNEKHKVPTAALILQCVLAILFLWVRSLDQLISLVVFSEMIFTILVIAAVPVLRRRLPNLERPYKVWGGNFTVLLTILVNFAIMLNEFQKNPMTCVIGLSVPAVGALVYMFFEFSNRYKKA